MTGSPQIAVVGAGLAGLVAARHLAVSGAEVTVFERRDRVGGRVRTRTVDDFLLDRGFQVLFTDYPAVRRELDLDGLSLQRFESGATLGGRNRRSVLVDPFAAPRSRSTLRSLPKTAIGRDVTPLDALRLVRLRLELARTPYDAIFDPSAIDEMDIETYLTRRGFSRRFLERFVRPFYGGITLDPTLSTSARVFRYTFKALSGGSAAVPAAGMGAIPAQLAAAAEASGVTIETGTTIDRVEAGGITSPADVGDVTVGGAGDVPIDGDEAVTGNEVGDVPIDGDEAVTSNGAGESTVAGDEDVVVAGGGETVPVDAAIVATDPPTARRLTGISSIPTEGRGCVTQYFALDDGVLDLPPRLHLNVDASPTIDADPAGPNQVAPLGAVAPTYAPEGRTILSSTYLGNPTASDEELANRTRRTLAGWYPERSVDGLALLATDRIEFAQFAQPPGIHRTLPDVDAPDGPIFLAGDYTSWSSIQGAMASGRSAARAALRAL